MHRPRGGGSTWYPIEPKVRVSNKAGKVLRIVLELAHPIDMATAETHLYYQDNNEWKLGDELFAMRSKSTNLTNGIHCVVFELKLTALYKTVIFDVTYEPKGQPGNRFQLRCVPFFAHNTGIPKPKTTKGKPPGTLEWINTFSGPVGDGDSDEEDQSHAAHDGGHSASAASAHRDSNTASHSKKKAAASAITAPDQTEASEAEQDITPALRIESDMHVNGSVLAQSYYQLSDIRLKFDIQDLVDSLEVIQSLQGKKFKWKPATAGEAAEGKDSKPTNSITNGRRVLGFIAQEVQKVLPNAVTASKADGFLAIDCTQLVPILIDAFKHQVKEFREIKAKMAQYQGHVTELVTEIKELIKANNAADLKPRKGSAKSVTVEASALGSRSKMVEFDVDDLKADKDGRVRINVGVLPMSTLQKITFGVLGAIAIGICAAIVGVCVSIYGPKDGVTPTPSPEEPPITWEPVSVPNGDFALLSNPSTAQGWGGDYRIAMDAANATDVSNSTNVLMLNGTGSRHSYATNYMVNEFNATRMRVSFQANTLNATISNKRSTTDEFIMALLILYYTSESNVAYFPMYIEPGQPWRTYCLDVCVDQIEPMSGFAITFSTNAGVALINKVQAERVDLAVEEPPKSSEIEDPGPIAVDFTI